MVDKECNDLQIGILEHHDAPLVVKHKGPGLTAEAVWGHHLGTMMGDAVMLVLAIGLHEAADHLFDARRAIHLDRLRVRFSQPALQHQFTQTVDMV